MEILAARLKELRQDKQKTQKEIAELLNIAVPSIQRYEYETRTPDLETLVKIAQYFNVSLDYLVGLTDKPN